MLYFKFTFWSIIALQTFYDVPHRVLWCFRSTKRSRFKIFKGFGWKTSPRNWNHVDWPKVKWLKLYFLVQSIFRVVSPTISFKSIQQITNILKRKPLIWDNIHANDYDRRRVFLGKFEKKWSSQLPKNEGEISENCLRFIAFCAN